MFCQNCGSRIDDNVRFCPGCGLLLASGAPAQQQTGAEQPGGYGQQQTGAQQAGGYVQQQTGAEQAGGYGQQQTGGQQPGGYAQQQTGGQQPGGYGLPEGMDIAPDGTICWTYEQNLWRNPAILYTVLKALLVTIAIVLVLIGGITAINGDFDLGEMLTIGGVVTAVFLVLGLIGYAGFALLSGGKYAMLFLMDETQVVHTQMPKEAARGRRISEAAILIGALTGNLSVTGMGMAHYGRDTMVSTFAKVKSIEQDRSHDLIKVRAGLEFNQIYASPAQYDFVLSHIASRCPGVRVE